MTALAHGPDAVGRHAGRVLFVPGAAPGDRVRVRVTEEHGQWARAVIVHHCTAGATRRAPPCPWVGACGGCPWQHVDYAAQLAAKATNVRESLRRIAGVTAARELPIVAAPSEWAYRHRIRLHAAGGELGYRRARSHELVPIDQCPIAAPDLPPLLAPLRALLAELRTRIDAVELVTNGRGGVAVALEARGRFAAVDAAVVERWRAATAAVAGVGVHGRGFTRRFGDTRLTVTPETGAPPIGQRLGTFTQVNAAANRRLVETVVQWVPSDATVLDLFCGSGNLSLPIARRARAVVGVDADADAIADAAASATAAGLVNARFAAGAADRWLERRGLAGADVVVLDPPRTGAAEAARRLADLRPSRVLYVSCEPTTLARDVRTLVAAGYVVDRLRPIDMFPQTEHVETVLEAVLTAP